MTDLTTVPDADLVREIYRRIKGESEMQYHRNYLYREALRRIYLFFDKQDIDEANIRMRKVADWDRIEATRNEVLDTSPTHDVPSGQGTVTAPQKGVGLEGSPEGERIRGIEGSDS